MVKGHETPGWQKTPGCGRCGRVSHSLVKVRFSPLAPLVLLSSLGCQEGSFEGLWSVCPHNPACLYVSSPGQASRLHFMELPATLLSLRSPSQFRVYYSTSPPPSSWHGGVLPRLPRIVLLLSQPPGTLSQLWGLSSAASTCSQSIWRHGVDSSGPAFFLHGLWLLPASSWLCPQPGQLHPFCQGLIMRSRPKHSSWSVGKQMRSWNY